MSRWFYYIVLAVSVGLSQLVFVDYSKEEIFPLATWNLFSQLPLKREISTLYFEDLNDGSLCYFYLCPRIDRSKITPYHAYHIVRYRQHLMNVEDYFVGKIDLQKLGYKVHIKTEATTMVEKWKEISQELRPKD